MAKLYRCNTCGWVTEVMQELAVHLMDHVQSNLGGTAQPGRPLPEADDGEHDEEK